MAFGTSAPELVVSVVSSVEEKSMIAVGNVVGSNICNIALVLGLSALFQPIVAQSSVVRRDIPLMLLISLVLLLLSLNDTLGRLEGALLLGGIIAYTLFNYYLGVKETKSGKSLDEVMDGLGVEPVPYVSVRWKQIALVIVGIVGVVGGAKSVVDSAVVIMTWLGVSEKFIGLTVVAFGTSLPELGNVRRGRRAKGIGYQYRKPRGEQCLQHLGRSWPGLIDSADLHSRRIL